MDVGNRNVDKVRFSSQNYCMNVLDDALEGLSRLYVAVPPLLIVALLLTLFFLTSVGESRLQRASVKESCANAGLRCIESYPDEDTVFTSKASIALFRIAQEAFTNVIKHAAATTVRVTLQVDRDQVVLRIADDGRGIPEGRFKATGAHGLVSMRHRILALAGQLDIESPPQGGTVLTAQVPATNAVVAGPLFATTEVNCKRSAGGCPKFCRLQPTEERGWTPVNNASRGHRELPPVDVNWPHSPGERP
jgi:signal transduction histidine kinase